MIDAVLARVFGTKNEREVKGMLPTVAAISALEPQTRELSDIDLAAKTIEFKEKIAQGATLDDLLIPAFAVVREAGRRVLNMRHFDVQLIGGMVLHKGKIADRKPGEGKKLVAPLPCYLNALAGNGVHVVTVNDSRARRDSEWMGRLYKFLGLKVGVIVHDLDDQERKDAYHADITYGTNNEFGFDYLRDNMKFRIEDCVQRVQNYTIDEKHKSAALTEEGVLRLEKLLNIGNLYDPQNIEWNHHVQQALRAHVLYQRDREYVVRDGEEGPEVVIVDEFTGRLMPGRRWSDGLHQAVEAKEGVKIQRENQTLATITFQNYFRM